MRVNGKVYRTAAVALAHSSSRFRRRSEKGAELDTNNQFKDVAFKFENWDHMHKIGQRCSVEDSMEETSAEVVLQLWQLTKRVSVHA